MAEMSSIQQTSQSQSYSSSVESPGKELSEQEEAIAILWTQYFRQGEIFDEYADRTWQNHAEVQSLCSQEEFKQKISDEIVRQEIPQKLLSNIKKVTGEVGLTGADVKKYLDIQRRYIEYSQSDSAARFTDFEKKITQEFMPYADEIMTQVQKQILSFEEKEDEKVDE